MGWGGSILDQNCNNKNGSLWMAESLDLMGSIGHTNGCLDLSVFYLASVIFKQKIHLRTHGPYMGGGLVGAIDVPEYSNYVSRQSGWIWHLNPDVY